MKNETPARLLPQDCFFTSEDGLRLHYKTYGDKKTAKRKILCLPGLTRNSKDFCHFALRRALAFDDFLICPDMRGRGRSEYDPNPMNYNVPKEAGDIIRMLELEGLERVSVVATSRGGFQIGVIAGLCPGLVDKCVLNDIGIKTPIEALERISAIFRLSAERFKEQSELSAFLRRFEGYANENYTPEEENDFFNANYTKKDGVFAQDFDTDGMKVGYEAGMVALRSLPEAMKTQDADFTALFYSLIQTPILLLRGRNSDLLTPEIARMTTSFLLKSNMVEISGRGHAPLLTEKEAITAIDEFLE